MSPRTPQGRFMWTIGLIGVLLVAMSAVNLVTLIAASNNDVWAPLGPYKTQTVVEVTDVAVIVEGTRCSSETPVRVMSTMSWHRLEPPGAQFGAGSGMQTLTFKDGCRTTTFINTIPAAVRALDLPGAEWVLVGVDTPIDSHGQFGQQIAWSTEPFILTPTDGA